MNNSEIILEFFRILHLSILTTLPRETTNQLLQFRKFLWILSLLIVWATLSSHPETVLEFQDRNFRKIIPRQYLQEKSIISEKFLRPLNVSSLNNPKGKSQMLNLISRDDTDENGETGRSIWSGTLGIVCPSLVTDHPKTTYILGYASTHCLDPRAIVFSFGRRCPDVRGNEIRTRGYVSAGERKEKFRWNYRQIGRYVGRWRDIEIRCQHSRGTDFSTDAGRFVINGRRCMNC